MTGDRDSAPDIAVLCRGIEQGIAELLTAGSSPTQAGRAKARSSAPRSPAKASADPSAGPAPALSPRAVD